MIVLNQTFASGDTFNPYAIHHILDQARQQLSEWPQWQPWIFSGMPSIEAFTYVNLLYLPSYLLDLIGVADLNIQFIHLIFSGVGMLLSPPPTLMPTPRAPSQLNIRCRRLLHPAVLTPMTRRREMLR